MLSDMRIAELRAEWPLTTVNAEVRHLREVAAAVVAAREPHVPKHVSTWP